MKFDETENEVLVDQAIDAVRSARPPADRINQSVQRVRNRLSRADGALSDCDDFQGLMPKFLAGDLAEAPRLLTEDHIASCPRCRRRLQNIAAGPAARMQSLSQKPLTASWIRWSGIAAAVLLCAFLLRTALIEGPAPFATEAWSVVEDARGPLFLLAGAELIPIGVGDRLDASTPIRTGSGSTAILKLADGSSIEISERAQLQIRRGWSGARIQLQRGAIIVEAAEQGRGRLSVDTADLRIDVRGTVFSVSRGLKGSRVSVLEGEVLVREGARELSLKAGDQFASGRKLTASSIESEVSWSRNADAHLEILGRLQEFGRELQLASVSESLRYSSELIEWIPADPVFIASVPNLTHQLDEVIAEFTQKMSQDPMVAEWLAGRFSNEGQNGFQAIVERLRAVGERLGPEVVLAIIQVLPDQYAPLILATAEDGAGLEHAIQAEVERLANGLDSGGSPPVAVTHDPARLSDSAEVAILIYGRLVAASTSPELLRQTASLYDGSSVSSFVGSPFHQSLMEQYAQGIDWLASIDLERLQSNASLQSGKLGDAHFAWLGVESVSSLTLQRKRMGEGIESRAVLRYEGADGGLAALLGSPGAMGGLEFVTPDAQLASAFVVRSPNEAVDRLFQGLERFNPEAWAEIVDFQIRNGVNFRDDLAATLGGEFIFAVDGSLLPAPSWKLILEVYDSEKFQQTMLRMIDALNRQQAAKGGPGYAVEPAPGGSNQYVLRSADGSGPEAVYGFDSGYLIAAPSTAVLSKAIQAQRSGYTLGSSAKLRQLLPHDARANLSALFYQQTGQFHDLLLTTGAGAKVEGSPELSVLQWDPGPSVFALYSEPNRLSLTSSGGHESLWGSLAAMAALGGGK